MAKITEEQKTKALKRFKVNHKVGTSSTCSYPYVMEDTIEVSDEIKNGMVWVDYYVDSGRFLNRQGSCVTI